MLEMFFKTPLSWQVMCFEDQTCPIWRITYPTMPGKSKAYFEAISLLPKHVGAVLKLNMAIIMTLWIGNGAVL